MVKLVFIWPISPRSRNGFAGAALKLIKFGIPTGSGHFFCRWPRMNGVDGHSAAGLAFLKFGRRISRLWMNVFFCFYQPWLHEQE